MPVPSPTLAVTLRSVACGSAGPIATAARMAPPDPLAIAPRARSSAKNSSLVCALVCPLQSERNCVPRGGTMSFKPTQCHLDITTPCESVVQIDVGDDRWLVPFIDFKVACSKSLPLRLGAHPWLDPMSRLSKPPLNVPSDPRSLEWSC